MRRSDDDYTTKIAALISDGAVGQITSARVRDGHPFALPRPGQPEGMLPAQFWDRSQAQGGVLIDLCHPVYLLAALMGRPDRVSAVLGHVTGRELEDNATVVLSFADGAVGIAETSSVSAITPFMIEIHGTEGSILYTEPGIGAFVLARQERAEGRADSGNDAAPGPDDRPRLRVRSTRPAILVARHRGRVGSTDRVRQVGAAGDRREPRRREPRPGPAPDSRGRSRLRLGLGWTGCGPPG